MLSRIVVTALALTSTATLASAQSPASGATPARPDVGPAAFGIPDAAVPDRSAGPATPPGAFLFSAGTDASAWDHVLGRWTPGVVVQVGYERRVGDAGSRYALRLAGDYWRSGGYALRGYDAGGAAGVTGLRRSTRLYGASLVGVAQLRTRGAVRPYVLAGAGVYQYVGLNQTAPSSGPTAVVRLDDDRATAFAATAGLGVSAKVGRVTPYAEFRVVNLLGLRTDNVAWSRAPLTLGVRLAF